MEKTDTIILSPEELAAYMAESTINVTSTYEHSPVVLMVDDTVIGTLGNFSASQENFQRFSHCRIGIEWQHRSSLSVYISRK